MSEPRIEPNADSLEPESEMTLRDAFSPPARCQLGNRVTQESLPVTNSRFEGEVPRGDSACRHKLLAQLRSLAKLPDMREKLIRCRGLQEIAPRLSVRRIRRVHPANKRNSRQPCVVELCRGLMKVCGASESSHRHHTVGFSIVMPAIRAADEEVEAKFVSKLFLPAGLGKFRRKIRAFAKEANVFKAVPARGIARNQIGVWPERHEGRVPQSPRVRLVLHEVKMRARMGDIVCHHADEEDTIRCSKIRAHRIGQSHQYSIAGKRMRQACRKAALVEGKPGLIDPALSAGNLSRFFELGDISGPPGFLPSRIRKISLRQIKMNLHETSRR